MGIDARHMSQLRRHSNPGRAKMHPTAQVPEVNAVESHRLTPMGHFKRFRFGLYSKTSQPEKMSHKFCRGDAETHEG